MQINIRKELKDLFDKHGHWVVLRQSLPGEKCSCISPTTDSPVPSCKICLGSGLIFVDRFVRCRKSRDVSLTQTLGAEVRSALRYLTPNEAVFYFRFDAKPTQADYILEVALDAKTGAPVKPFKVLAVYDISDAREHRDQNGRIEFYSVTADKQAWPEFKFNG